MGDSNGIVGTAIDVLDEFGNPIGEVTCLNNVISEGYVRNLSGDILSLTYGQMDGKAWVLTELPTILSENKVTSINGIPMEELQSMYRIILESGVTEAKAVMDKAAGDIWGVILDDVNADNILGQADLEKMLSSAKIETINGYSKNRGAYGKIHVTEE